jgi:hypothetical protein
LIMNEKLSVRRYCLLPIFPSLSVFFFLSLLISVSSSLLRLVSLGFYLSP